MVLINRIETLHVISIKMSQKYFVHLKWISLAVNLCWLNSSMGIDQQCKNPKI